MRNGHSSAFIKAEAIQSISNDIVKLMSIGVEIWESDAAKAACAYVKTTGQSMIQGAATNINLAKDTISHSETLNNAIHPITDVAQQAWGSVNEHLGWAATKSKDYLAPVSTMIFSSVQSTSTTIAEPKLNEKVEVTKDSSPDHILTHKS